MMRNDVLGAFNKTIRTQSQSELGRHMFRDASARAASRPVGLRISKDGDEAESSRRRTLGVRLAGGIIICPLPVE
jgi:hypothetical protein